MSLQIPRPGDLPTATADEDPTKTRKARTSIGIGLILVAVISSAAMIWLYSLYGAGLATLSDSDRSEQAVFVTLNIFYFLALSAVGIWNIAARRSTSKLPLIAALVLSCLALTFTAINILDFATTSGRIPSLFMLFLNVGICVQTLRLLLVKPT
ncbi:hypothetical protein StoSoilA2_21140 [Arthrobacter sp. StoSoilA2]|uniref:hypothetical protein n=1 Tax=Arthrobacter sp. StoSoilA2 TaxID=2830990 RepID=UPI001CC3FEFD|nr:hypothetical protein [Arthrobacter sp. StoSoilA2]BCW36058.1 hypothetical protein StoSoilA2_21140 [Arthrobacter sp. StoSoilA2]